MIIGIDMGHTLRGVGTEAVGIKSETGLNRPLGNKVIELLRQLGHTVINCTMDEEANSLSQIVRNANKQYLDIFISFHFNCGGGHGVEVLVYDNKSIAAINYAEKVLNEIVKLGYRNRGIKYRPDLYVLNSTSAQAILVKCAFIDSKEDMDRYDVDKMAQAIVLGLIGKLSEETQRRYFVRTGDFQVSNGLEINNLRNKYFSDIERVYVNPKDSYVYIETQYLSKEKCNEIVNRLGKDNLYASLVEE